MGTELELRCEQELSVEVLESMEQGIIVWSDDGICELVNSRYYSMLNQGMDSLVVGMSRGTYFQRLVDRGEATEEMVNGLEANLLKRQPFSIERKTAAGVVVAVDVRPMQSGGHVVTYSDITVSKNNQDILSRTIKRAETAEVSARDALTLEQERKAEARGLAELSDWLQCCKSIDELYEIVSQALSGMIPDTSGQLFIYSNSRDVLDGAVVWGRTELSRSIQPQDCWSLRRGRTFQYGDGVVKFPCNHVNIDENSRDEAHYLCLPIIAQGDTVGMLHIDFTERECENNLLPIDDVTVAFAQRCAEQISMAIANVKLRDELHEQSTRDPLTGLFNRRYFLERCRSALSQVERESGSVALISFDADNFKSYNDQFGHDAGDSLLCIVGELTGRFFSNNEVCCRTGGEEFSILLPDTTAAQALTKAEEFIHVIEQHEFRYRDQLLPTVTVSAGVAAYPENADSLAELSRAADLAMYDAKELGKNCVCSTK